MGIRTMMWMSVRKEVEVRIEVRISVAIALGKGLLKPLWSETVQGWGDGYG